MTTYKGKTAQEWYKLHEVMRRDFKRLLADKSRKHITSGQPCWCNPKTIKVFGVSKGQGPGEWIVGDGDNIVATVGNKSHANLFASALNNASNLNK